MTYDETSGDYTLSSGRRFSAFTGVIGLGGRSAERGFTVGGEWVADAPRWTAEERAELADEMIRRWTAFKAPQGTQASEQSHALT